MDNFQGIKNTCNWCGSNELKFIGSTYFDPHPHHFIYECEMCHKHTWSHFWWARCQRIQDNKFRGR